MQTLEQMTGKRKKLLTDMVAQMSSEVRRGVAADTSEQAAGMVRTLLEPMLQRDAQVFNSDVQFQAAVAEALKAKRTVELSATMAAVPLLMGSFFTARRALLRSS